MRKLVLATLLVPLTAAAQAGPAPELTLPDDDAALAPMPAAPTPASPRDHAPGPSTAGAPGEATTPPHAATAPNTATTPSQTTTPHAATVPNAASAPGQAPAPDAAARAATPPPASAAASPRGVPTSKQFHAEGLRAFNARRYADAVDIYQRGVAVHPESAHLHAMLGKCLLWSGRARDAVPPLSRAVAMAPQRAPYHVVLGDALRASGHPTQAAVSYRRALELEPDNQAAIQGLQQGLATSPQAQSGGDVDDDSPSPMVIGHGALIGGAAGLGLGLLLGAALCSGDTIGCDNAGIIVLLGLVMGLGGAFSGTMIGLIVYAIEYAIWSGGDHAERGLTRPVADGARGATATRATTRQGSAPQLRLRVEF